MPPFSERLKQKLPVPKVDTPIEYWYGEEEKKARKDNLAYTCRVYPQTVAREFPGLAHAELVMVYPEKFYEEVTRFMGNGKKGTA